jgi:hypothetical protein
MTQEHDRVAGSEWVYTGGGCSEVGSGSSGIGGGDAYADFSLTVQDGEVFVQVTEGGKVTEERRSDDDFLRSGKKDRVLMQFESGRTRRFTFWGGPECIEPEMPNEEEILRILEPRDAGASR